MLIAHIEENEHDREEFSRNMSVVFKNLGIGNYHLHFFDTPENFLKALEVINFDVAVMDTDINGKSGFELACEAHKISQEIKIVFFSESNNFASESYDVNAKYYIRKPITEKKIHLMLERILEEEYDFYRKVILPDGQRLSIRSIVYTQCYKQSILFHMKNGNIVRSRITMKHLSELLRECSYFVQCNKGMLVNLFEVFEVRDFDLKMTIGEPVVISRSRIKEFKEKRQLFLIEQLRQHM